MKKFLLSLFSCILFIQCAQDVRKISEQDALQLAGKELLQNINLDYSDSGKVVMNIKAPELLRSYKAGQSQDEFRKGILASFFTAGELTNTLSSNYALRVLEDGKTYLSDHVVLLNPKGEKLETSELTWDERNSKVYTSKFVRLSRQDEVVQGYGFESDQNFLKGTIQSIEARFPASKILPEEDEELK
ncbi:MAG: LPS export ABC transporter periplasmic protein LptC [Saprospiraceae bacterium]|nr:LPS export ABC transporter periplasmic protein LptC [Saprospiraceae bacterium]HMW40342.1 LPS export ABC transporter periplasmic protein LptC [Saprospiraceae bacterium]HMX88473.1 LPS export ABC transporter periplasmic protein LptC [Saprospiraceae bacterium]HMZ40346.1 LPS export ABC transporter periplasmic protein LptC [Saprospiraceae bacterium]HNA64754.1 LPS export ABC transporter periplasmic protein LptC [Saprospiraceae bacterium]